MSIAVDPVCAPPHVVDAAIDAYVFWREECADVRKAYHRWSSAAKGDRMLACCAYIAALDREEIAASVYAAAMRRLGDECVEVWRAEARRVWGGDSS